MKPSLLLLALAVSLPAFAKKAAVKGGVHLPEQVVFKKGHVVARLMRASDKQA